MDEITIDDVKMRVVELLGEDFPRYSAEDIAELESALRTDDPEELEHIYARWRERGPLKLQPPVSTLDYPDCADCQRARERFGGDFCVEHTPPGM